MRREHPGLFLAPTAVTLGAVALFPALAVLWLSFEQRSPLAGPPRFIGVENYAQLLTDGRFWNALWNTAYFAVVSVALELLLGLAIALLLARAFRGRALLYSLILLPWAMPTVVSARLWEWMYNADYGVINYLLGAHVNWLGSPTWALHAAILVDVWKTTPFVALLLLAGLQTIPRDLYAAAALDGAKAWTMLRHITLPLLAPVMLVVLIFRTIDAFRVFDTIYVLTGGGPANTTETLSIYAYKVLFQNLQFGYGSALAVSVLAVVALLTIFYARLLRERIA